MAEAVIAILVEASQSASEDNLNSFCAHLGEGLITPTVSGTIRWHLWL